MRYINGKDVLPPELLKEIQKYLSGELMYIPRKDEPRAAWGQKSGLREQVFKRNSKIVELYRKGKSVLDLTDEYCLSEASIRKIIYSSR